MPCSFWRLISRTPLTRARGSKAASGIERCASHLWRGLPCQAMPTRKPEPEESRRAQRWVGKLRLNRQVGHSGGDVCQGRPEQAGQAQEGRLHVEGRQRIALRDELVDFGRSGRREGAGVGRTFHDHPGTASADEGSKADELDHVAPCPARNRAGPSVRAESASRPAAAASWCAAAAGSAFAAASRHSYSGQNARSRPSGAW